MATSKYNRIGLRRDKNFSDLSNSTEALNNLLDTLVDDSSFTFVSEDLDAIRGTYSSGLNDSQYRQIINSEIKISNQNGISTAINPKITYQNRLDRFKVFSGEPILNGGNGLTAKYYDKESIFENTVGIFSGSPIKIDNFWELGNFLYTDKITPELIDSNGGVEWEGYFIPTTSGQHTFKITSSAGFTFDFQTEGYISGIGTYTEISRIGIASTVSGSGSSGSNVITISPTNTKYVSIGQSVFAVGITTGSTVSNFNRSTGVIDLSPPTGINTSVYANFSGNVTFSKSIGQVTYISYTTYTLNQFQRYRIRFRYFIPPSIDASEISRSILFDIFYPNGVDYSDLRYTSLYSLDYDFSSESQGDLSNFLNNSILTGGGTIGGSSNSSDYIKLKSNSKVDIKYSPKTSVSGIIKLVNSGSITSGTNIISISDTTNIEVGNYVFGTGVPEGTVVNEIGPNSFIVLSQNATSTSTNTYTFIDHRGFVKRAFGSSGGATFNLSSGNTTNLKSGMIMIGSGVQSYTGITTTGSTSSFTISPSQSIGAGTTVYFYQSRGLINNSLDGFCIPSQTRCLIATANAGIGTNVIQVSSTSGITINSQVQGFQFDPGTIVNNFTTTTITLNIPIIKNIIAGANFTVTSLSEDRTLCCPPTDTSPPFNPTTDGLETVVDAPNLNIESGNILFKSLRVNSNPSTITSYSTSNLSGSRISIRTPSVQVGSGTTTIFKILCT